MKLPEIQSAATALLAKNLPEVTVVNYHESIFEDSKPFKSINAPAVLVIITQIVPNPNLASHYKAILSLAAIVVPESGTALESDESGWTFSERIAKAVYGKTFDQTHIRPTQGATITKQERLDKENEPTGLYYWTVTWEHEFNYDNSI